MFVKKLIGRVIIGVSTVLLIATAGSVAMPLSWSRAIQDFLMNFFGIDQAAAQVIFVLIVMFLFVGFFFFGCFGTSLLDAAESEEKK